MFTTAQIHIRHQKKGSEQEVLKHLIRLSQARDVLIWQEINYVNNNLTDDKV